MERTGAFGQVGVAGTMGFERATWYAAVAAHQNPHLDAAADGRSLRRELYEFEVAVHLQEVVRNSDLRIRTRPEYLLDILTSDGFCCGFRFRARFPDRDVSYWEKRSSSEAKMFAAVVDDLGVLEGRPVYGYFYDTDEPPTTEPNADNHGRLYNYGDVVVVIKDEVKLDCTYTFGDTIVDTLYCERALFCPSTYEEPHHLPFNHERGDPFAIGRSGEFRQETSQGVLWNYIEAQVHGPITPTDIARVVFLSGTPDPELVAALDEREIESEVVGG